MVYCTMPAYLCVCVETLISPSTQFSPKCPPLLKGPISSESDIGRYTIRAIVRVRVRVKVAVRVMAMVMVIVRVRVRSSCFRS